MAKVKTPKTGLTKKHWFGYMFGDWGGCMTFALMASTFTMYCTNALGIDLALLGTLVIIWTIWDAVNDPMMGALMDKMFAKKQDKRGKFRPWLLRATPLAAACNSPAVRDRYRSVDCSHLLRRYRSDRGSVLLQDPVRSILHHVQYPHGLSAVRNVHQ